MCTLIFLQEWWKFKYITYQIWLQGKFTKGRLYYIGFFCLVGFLKIKLTNKKKNQTTDHHQNTTSTMKYSQVMHTAFGEYCSLNRSMSTFQMMNLLGIDAHYIPIGTHYNNRMMCVRRGVSVLVRMLSRILF